MPSSMDEQCIDTVSEPGPLVPERGQRGAPRVRQAVVAARRARGGLPPEGGDELLLAQPCEQRVDRALARDEPVDRRQAADELEPVALVVAEEREHAVLEDAAAELRERVAGGTRFHATHDTWWRHPLQVTSVQPLTLGTAGHIDHGKTVLVRALTGVDTDRLPEERERGISIELGYAPLELPSGRRLSVVDVPGHERFVRTMVAGATGIDLFLMVVAADDGVMPQTREHAAVLRALGVGTGVVAITKADLADPARAAAEAAELLPGAETVPVAARVGRGLEELRAALERAAAGLDRPHRDGPLRLHVDRSFTIRGAGTVVTGTLWSGTAAPGDEVRILPAGRTARVRSVQVHDEPRERADAGQRVALNLAGVAREEAAGGDVVVGRAPAGVADGPARSGAAGGGMAGAGPAALAPTFRVDVA